MSFTSTDTVRLLLIGPSGNARHVTDERNRFDDSHHIMLAFLPVEPDTAVVKGLHRNQLYGISILMNGTGWLTLPDTHLVPDTVAVVDGAYLNTFFIEGIDFLIDYENGRIKRIASGAIGDGDPVTMYYQAYDLFTETTDYVVDYSTGIITRVTNGAILNNEIVWVDYTIAASGATDALLEAAIAEAHAQILVRLAPPYDDESEDALLASGEAELACAVAARTLAAQPLALNRDASGDDRALAWLKIAERFEQSAWKTLQPFLIHPIRKSGYAVKNG